MALQIYSCCCHHVPPYEILKILRRVTKKFLIGTGRVCWSKVSLWVGLSLLMLVPDWGPTSLSEELHRFQLPPGVGAEVFDILGDSLDKSAA
jgi:hypothetical protein